MAVLLLELVGVILLGIGLWFVSPAVCLIVVGVFIVLFAQALERGKKAK